jgi:PPOX class probable F420-dependent enzyme
MSEPLNSRIRAFLEAPRFAVVATINSDGSPQLTVLWYELQGSNEVLLNMPFDHQKVENLRNDPRVGIAFEDSSRYVAMYGTATILDDPDTAQEDIRRLAGRYLGDAADEQMANEVLSQQERVSIRVQIERVDMTGFDV